jgi:hypothetical protein
METINQRLKSLYEREAGEESGIFRHEGLSAPMLIKFADEEAVENADVRLMFFGKETQDWFPSTDSIGSVMDGYRKFFNDFDNYEQVPEDVPHCWQMQKKSSGFWRVLMKMKNAVAEQLPNKKISYIWNNIVKANYGYGKKVPSTVYSIIRDANRRIILGECDIVKPDIIVFFTGPDYDKKIDDVFKDVSRGDTQVKKDVIEIDGNKNALAAVHLPRGGVACVTYHPRGLETSSNPNIKKTVLDHIVALCAKAAR